jgi:hypothetical protein
MKASQRRTAFGIGFVLVGLLGAYAYLSALVPATHPDHDHGILNLDSGGKLYVTKRDASRRNLVGRPGHVLVVHFFSTGAAGAAAELAGLFDLQRRLADDPGVEFVSIAQEPTFAVLDSWLQAQGLKPPRPESVVLDPSGDTTTKLNCKRPLETMVFNPEGKLSSQARGAWNWTMDGPSEIEKARSGTTIE